MKWFGVNFKIVVKWKKCEDVVDFFCGFKIGWYGKFMFVEESIIVCF